MSDILPPDPPTIGSLDRDVPTLQAKLATTEAALAESRERADKTQEGFDAMLARAEQLVDELAESRTKLAAAEAVVEAAERLRRETFGTMPHDTTATVPMIAWKELAKSVANYHKATGPQAENEGSGK